VSADRAEPIDEPHSLNIQTIFFEPDPQRKMYKKIPINGQHEVIGMSGDIALYQGNPVVHTHIVVGNPDGTTRAGHVLAAYASPTLEVIVTVDPVAMQKRFDPATDLTLIDPALK
jgi:predicted DNA-binding protein with PD1-like motif